ncbi:MAG: Gfo/Idh/MocA family oxidoreductase [Frankiaceae bacterium]
MSLTSRSVALLVDVADASLAAAVAGLAAHLDSCGVPVRNHPEPADVVLVFADRPPTEGELERLSGEASLLLAGPTLHAWRDSGVGDLLGLLPGRLTPTHEIRLRPGPGGTELAARMDVPLMLTDCWLQLDKAADDVEVLLTAYAGLVEHPVLTVRRTARGAHGAFTVGSSPATVADPRYHRLVHRWLRAAAGLRDAGPVRIGMLGYGAVGVEHAGAIARVVGLELAGVCDLNPARVAAARQVAPDITAYPTPETLLDAESVDVVIVSTPPNTHADWSLRALERDKSVVVEKPFCTTVAEADGMIALAAERGRALAVYQNRRWDRDYLALRAAVRAGAIGEVFHYESFVGGYGHPCNYWHSDAGISGGALYDWGAHYLDWILDLLPQQIDYVTAHDHKRIWHDVTNADSTRVSLHFADGVEADFLNSDLAAALKPKWYVLGTRGTLVGSWRRSAVLARDPVGNLVEDRLAPGESPADLTLHATDGSVTALAQPQAPDAPFHRELADLLLTGVPMSVTPHQARRTVSVLAAATESICLGGRPVIPAPEIP